MIAWSSRTYLQNEIHTVRKTKTFLDALCYKIPESSSVWSFYVSNVFNSTILNSIYFRSIYGTDNLNEDKFYKYYFISRFFSHDLITQFPNTTGFKTVIYQNYVYVNDRFYCFFIRITEILISI